MEESCPFSPTYLLIYYLWSLWTHGFVIYSLYYCSYSPSAQIIPDLASERSSTFSYMASSFFLHVLLSWHNKMFHAPLMFFLLQPLRKSFLHEILVPFCGELYLKMNFWAQALLITPECLSVIEIINLYQYP